MVRAVCRAHAIARAGRAVRTVRPPVRGKTAALGEIMAPGHGAVVLMALGPTAAPDTDTAAMRGITGTDPDAPRVQRAITVPDFQT